MSRSLLFLILAFIIPPPPRAPPASVETTPARKFSSSLDRDTNEIRASKLSREIDSGSREGSKDKISPKIASIQQQLVNLTSPTSGEPPSSLSNNEVNYDEKDVPIPFKIKSDTLSRKKIIGNTREIKSWGKDDSGFVYKGEVGIPPPPPPPRSSIPKGMPAPPNTRSFANNISVSPAISTRPANPASFKLPLKTEIETSPAKKSPSGSSPMSNSKLRSTSSSDSLSSNASVNTVKSVSPVEERNTKIISSANKTTFGVKLSPIKDVKKKEDLNNDDDDDSNPPSLPPRLSSPVKSPAKHPPPPPLSAKSPSKENVLPPSPKPALPSRAKKPSPVHSSPTNNHISPTSSSPHSLGSRSLPQLPKPTVNHKSSVISISPKTSPKSSTKFGGHKSEHNGCNGSIVKVHNGSSVKNNEDEKPMLPQKMLSPNDRSTNGRKLPIPPPSNSDSESNSNSTDTNKIVGNGKVRIPSHLTNGHSNHDNSIPPAPPSPRTKPRGVSGSPLRINQSPNKISTTSSSASSNTPSRKFEFGSKKNGFVEGSYKGNGHIPNGHSPSANNTKEVSDNTSHSMNHKQKTIKENGHHHHSEVYLNSQFDLYEDGTSVDGEDHVDYNDQHDNEVSYVVQNGMNGELR